MFVVVPLFTQPPPPLVFGAGQFEGTAQLVPSSRDLKQIDANRQVVMSAASCRTPSQGISFGLYLVDDKLQQGFTINQTRSICNSDGQDPSSNDSDCRKNTFSPCRWPLSPPEVQEVMAVMQSAADPPPFRAGGPCKQWRTDR